MTGFMDISLSGTELKIVILSEKDFKENVRFLKNVRVGSDLICMKEQSESMELITLLIYLVMFSITTQLPSSALETTKSFSAIFFFKVIKSRF